jgi:hypothetical protein
MCFETREGPINPLEIENTFHSIHPNHPNVGRSRILKPFSYAIKHSRFFSLYFESILLLMLGLTPLGYGPQGYNLQIMRDPGDQAFPY